VNKVATIGVTGVHTIRYDTIRYESLTWTGKLSIQIYLAHVASKRNQNKQRQCPFNTEQVKIREVIMHIMHYAYYAY